MSSTREIVRWSGSSGELVGTVQVPEGDIKGAVVLSHCFTCSRSLRATRRLADSLEQNGYAVLRYDFAGLGDSEGDFADTTVTSNIADVEAAASYMVDRDLGPLVMAGHSLGGAATLLAAGSVSATRAVVAIAAPFSAEHVRHLFTEEDVELAFCDGTAEVNIGGRPFRISREFFEDLEEHCTPVRLAAIERPLLVTHAPADEIVPIDEGLRIFDAASQPKWFAAIPNGDHLFATPGSAELVGDVSAAFLQAALP